MRAGLSDGWTMRDGIAINGHVVNYRPYARCRATSGLSIVAGTMGAAYHWLVVQGFWRAIVTWTVGFLMGTVLKGGLKRAWEQHMRAQHLIADRLDTETPGGLGDLMAEERRKRVEGLHRNAKRQR